MAYKYPNGKMPAKYRRQVRGQRAGVELENKAAYWFERARDDASRRGLTLNIALPAGAYRTVFIQGDMRKNPRKYNLNPDNTLSLAMPGYSGHGWGDRVDVVGTGLSWFIKNCGTYGFRREYGARDPNHFVHNGRAIPASSQPASTTPAPIEKEDDTMLYARSKKTGKWYVIPELAPVLVIPTGGANSANYKRARAYSDARGRKFTVMDGEQIRLLMTDNATRREAFFDAMGNHEAVQSIRKELQVLLEAEPAE